MMSLLFNTLSRFVIDFLSKSKCLNFMAAVTVHRDFGAQEIRRWLLLGRKAMTNLDSVLKSIDMTLPTNVHIVKAMVFPVVRHGCDSWTLKKAEHKELMFSNCGTGEDSWESLGHQGEQPSLILKEINLEYSLEGLILKLKLQYFGTWCKKPTHWKRPWCWERLKAKGEEDSRGWDI